MVDLYAYRNQVKMPDGRIVGEFSNHWPATAAIIRYRKPEFKSLGGDLPEDLAEEKEMSRRIKESE